MLMFVSLCTILGGASASQYAANAQHLSAGYGGEGAGGLVGHVGGALNHASPYYQAEAVPLVSAGLGAGGYGGAGGHGSGHGHGHNAPLPIHTAHNIQYHPVHSGGHIRPVGLDIYPNVVPMNMMFRSASSFLNVKQTHLNAPGSAQETSSHDEPHLLRHSVQKPILQEIHEVVKPYRKIVQEVHPVREKIDTFVARGVHGPLTGRSAAAGLIGGHGGLVEGNGEYIAAGHPVETISQHHGGEHVVATHGAPAPAYGDRLVSHGVASHHTPVYAEHQPILSKHADQQIVTKSYGAPEHSLPSRNAYVSEQYVSSKQYSPEQSYVGRNVAASEGYAYAPKQYAPEHGVINRHVEQFVTKHYAPEQYVSKPVYDSRPAGVEQFVSEHQPISQLVSKQYANEYSPVSYISESYPTFRSNYAY